MAWIIELDRAAEKELDKIDAQVAKRILCFLFERLASADNPRSLGEALKGSHFENLWKYRVGDYRLICRIEDLNIKVIVLKVGNRREVYR